MEIDIFPIPHRKDGMARNFDKGFLGILIISYIIAAFQKGRWRILRISQKKHSKAAYHRLSYIDCMVNELPIRKAAEECGMAASTSFAWRHKILDVLRSMSEGVTLSGITESDDTYFPLSFKGNHQKSKDFDMGRPARKRGGDGISKGLSDDLVCVPCAVDRKGNSVAEVSNLGECSASDLDNVLGRKLQTAPPSAPTAARHSASSHPHMGWSAYKLKVVSRRRASSTYNILIAIIPYWRNS